MTKKSARTRGEIPDARIGVLNGASPPPRGRKRTAVANARSRNGCSAGPASSAPRRDVHVLALIRERPGITVAEAGKALSVDPTCLYRVVARLEQRGETRKTGRNLAPAAKTSASAA